MKRNKIKLLAVAALFALAVPFVGCSGDNDTSTPAPVANEAVDTTETPEPPAPVADAIEEALETEEVEEAAAPGLTGFHDPVDLGGRTIRIAGWWETLLPGTVDPEEPDPAVTGNYFIARQMWDNARRIEQEFNVNFDENVVPWEDLMPAITTSVMAGDPIADLFLLPGDGILTASVGNLITPLDSINLPGSDLLGARQAVSPTVDFGGHLWSMMQNGVESNGLAIGINLDIINAVGAQNPVDLFNAGQWNWDNMLEIMRLATLDTTGDGLTDQFGIGGDWGDIVLALVGANDGSTMTDDFQYNFDSPEIMEVFDFIETIAQERLWNYDGESGDELSGWARNGIIWQEGTSALFPIRTWMVPEDTSVIPFEYAIVPFPAGPSNTSGATFLAPWGQGWTIPAGVYNPEEALMIFEEIFTWPGMDDLGMIREEGIEWIRTRFLTEEDVQRKVYIGDNVRLDIGITVPEYSWIVGSFVSAFWNNEGTVAQVAEQNRPVSQERLDNFFDR